MKTRRVAFVALVVLIFTIPGHRAPMYNASGEVTAQEAVRVAQQFYCPAVAKKELIWCGRACLRKSLRRIEVGLLA
jgi:hypothetical protein